MMRRSPLSWSMTAAMTLAVVAAASPAAAQDTSAPDVAIAWTAPPECPTEARVRAELASILSGSTAAGHVEAQALITRAGERWHVDLTIRAEQGAGERSFDALSCSELASAVALIVGLAFDPTRRDPSDPAPSREASFEASPRPTPSPAAPSPADRPARQAAGAAPLRMTLAAGAVVDVGVLPSPGFGAAASVGILFGRTRLEARAARFTTQRAHDAARPSQGVEIDVLGAGARGCFALFASERVSAAPCLGVGLERLAGTGFGGDSTFSRAEAWVALEGGLLAAWAIAPFFALRGGVALMVPTSRPSFVVLASDGSVAGVLHRPAAVAARFEFGAELRIF